MIERNITSINDLSEKEIHFFNNKTRAISCKWLRRSTTEKDYSKYLIKYIRGGKLREREIYGKDMQEAINRFSTYLKHKDMPPNKTSTLGIIGVLLIISSFVLVASFKLNLLWLLIPVSLALFMVYNGYYYDINSKKVLRGEV